MKIIDSHNYEIYFGEESIRFLPEIVAQLQPSQIIFLYDNNSHHFCAPLIDKILYSVRYLKQFDKDKVHSIIIPSGELHKNLNTTLQIWNKLLEYQIDRKAVMICVGGGMVSDMGNFSASVWKRGIRSVLIPTTLLSMIDASCGGKCGIDFQDYKNIIGTFSNPSAVICDPLFLKSLSHREVMSGFAEMLKHAIIANNFQQLFSLETVDYKIIVPFIQESLETKNNIVLQDLKEENLRKILNFGHTIGHALERASLSTENPLLHGEAVAWGMLAEARLANILGQFDEEPMNQLKNVIEKHYSFCKFPFEKEAILQNMLNDKKNDSGKIIFSLPFPEKFISLDAKNDKELIFRALDFIK